MMRDIAAFALGCVSVVFALFIAGFLDSPKAPPPPPVIEGDVRELLRRLETVVKPQYEWRRPRVTVRSGEVEVYVEFNNGDKMSGSAATLREAVDRMSLPSAELRNALEGWR